MQLIFNCTGEANRVSLNSSMASRRVRRHPGKKAKAAMYLCLCHGLNDRRVREIASECGGSVGAVFRSLGVKPRCRRCVPSIKAAVKAVQQESAAPGPSAPLAPAE